MNAAALTITANNDSKTYGTNKTFSGTAFTETGLVNSDMRHRRDPDEPGAAATATVAGSPYAIATRPWALGWTTTQSPTTPAA